MICGISNTPLLGLVLGRASHSSGSMLAVHHHRAYPELSAVDLQNFNYSDFGFKYLEETHKFIDLYEFINNSATIRG